MLVLREIGNRPQQQRWVKVEVALGTVLAWDDLTLQCCWFFCLGETKNYFLDNMITFAKVSETEWVKIQEQL